MRRFLPLSLALALLFAAGAAFGQVPNTMSYQGLLTDNAGVAVPDGPYNLTFKLYSVPSGGTVLWTEVHNSVSVVKGAFSVVLGSPAPLTLPFDVTYFLGITVATDPELTPRVQLTSSPYALSLRLPFAPTTVASTSPLLDLDNTGTGLDLRCNDAQIRDAAITERATIGGTSFHGDIQVVRGGTATLAGRLYSNSSGGNLELNLGSGARHTEFLPFASGGAALQMYRPDGQPGFIANTSFGFTGVPFMSVVGAARAASFDMNQTGDASVSLPVDAISSQEMLDEPGVASANGTTTVFLTGAFDPLLSRTITSPSSGYCLVIGTLEVDVMHTNGTTSSADFGVSNNSGSLPGTQDVPVEIPPAAATGTYRFPVTVHGLFNVGGASPTTFYIVGHKLSGNYSFADIQLSVAFFPTSYGTVSPTGAQQSATDAVVGQVVSPADIAREQRESELEHRARVDRELSDMRARLLALQSQLNQVSSRPAGTPPGNR
jgi:hypothetical protein